MRLTVVAALKAALLHQGLVALLIFLVGLGLRSWLPPAAAGGGPAAAPASAEPAWRQVLRISFGLIWIVDGILQPQAARADSARSRLRRSARPLGKPCIHEHDQKQH